MKPGDEVIFRWGKEVRTGKFVRVDGAYHYFRCDDGSIVELYEGEFDTIASSALEE